MYTIPFSILFANIKKDCAQVKDIKINPICYLRTLHANKVLGHKKILHLPFIALHSECWNDMQVIVPCAKFMGMQTICLCNLVFI